MNHLYKIILSSALLLCHFTPITAKLPTAVELSAMRVKTYVNEEAYYSIEYPLDWIDTNKGDILDLFLVKPSKNDVSTSVSMCIISEHVGDSITLEDVYSEIVTYFAESGMDIKSGDYDLDGIPSKWVLYNFEMNTSDAQILVLQYLVVAQETKYIITFGSTVDDFDVYLPEFETIVSSFRLLQE